MNLLAKKYVLEKDITYYRGNSSNSNILVILDDPFGSVVLWESLVASFSNLSVILIPYKNDIKKIEFILDSESVDKAIFLGFGQGNTHLSQLYDKRASVFSAVITVAPVLRTVYSFFGMEFFLKLLSPLSNKRIPIYFFRKRGILNKFGIISPYINKKLFKEYLKDRWKKFPSISDFSVVSLSSPKFSVPHLLIVGDRDPLAPQDMVVNFDSTEKLLVFNGGRLAFWEFFDMSVLRIKKFFRDNKL